MHKLDLNGQKMCRMSTVMAMQNKKPQNNIVKVQKRKKRRFKTTITSDL